MSRRTRRRPSPEALLEAAKQEGRGRLKIFLGAAPGVGKTYEMLLSAQAQAARRRRCRRRRRRDAWPRGDRGAARRASRSSRAAASTTRAACSTEMDLDAILTRRPQLVLVDELAHTNAPGSRHPKRYLDVEELLAAGIDVYTTLNIQHVESLNDVVAQITRIRVRETVPDCILDQADDIEVVDLTPDDLIQRLQEGKVYVPQQAERAVRHYFSARQSDGAARAGAAAHGAARRRADAVATCARTRSPARGRRASACWSASARTRAAPRLDPLRPARSPTGCARRGRRSMSRRARTQRLDEAERDRIADCLRLAERLGGAGDHHSRRATSPTRSSPTPTSQQHHPDRHRQVRAARAGSRCCTARSSTSSCAAPATISVHVIAGRRRRAGAAEDGRRRAAARRAVRPAAPIVGSAGSGRAGARRRRWSCSSFIDVAKHRAGVPDGGARRARSPGACGRRCSPASLSVLAYNFFFLPPLYTFTIADPENVVALFFFADRRGHRQQSDGARRAARS